MPITKGSFITTKFYFLIYRYTVGSHQVNEKILYVRSKEHTRIHRLCIPHSRDTTKCTPV